MRDTNMKAKDTVNALKTYVVNKNKSDEGADVLVVAMIVLPLIIAAVGFALDITKNTYLSNSYETMAQASVSAASNERNISGELTRNSGPAFIREYMRQRGTDTSHLSREGVQSSETLAFRPERCDRANASDIEGISGTGAITFPYVRIDYASLRAQGGNFGTTRFVSQNGAVPNMSTYNPRGSYVMTVEVYDVASNYFLGVMGHNCQIFRSEVSSTVVLEDQDFNNR